MSNQFELHALPTHQSRFHSLNLIISLVCLLTVGQTESIFPYGDQRASTLTNHHSRALFDTKDTPYNSQLQNNSNLPFISGRSYDPRSQKQNNQPSLNVQDIGPNPLFPKLNISGRKLNTKKPTISKARSQMQIATLINREYSAYESNQISGEQLNQAKEWRKLLSEQQFSQRSTEEYNLYEQKYAFSEYEELPFCLVVPTYNNLEHDRYLRNVRSILQQNYTNYRLIIIDDHSSDGTADKLETFMAEQRKLQPEHYKLVKNANKLRAMANIRKAAIEYCLPQEIFMIVDGDDELIGRQVLKLFNAAFQKDKAWFVYSNFILSKSQTTGYSKPFPRRVIQANTYRYYPFVTSHLRAYYTQLLRNIREEDLRDQNGEYFSSANDVALCLPILQQAQKRVSYLPQITYWYNSDTGQNNHLLRPFEQKQNEHVIRRKPNYEPLEYLFEGED